MKHNTKTVAIKTLPEHLDAANQSALYRELESCINVDRPAVVLDCSRLRDLDSLTIHFLLCCLEEAIKRNGDVRLAELRPEVGHMFRTTGMCELFQTFDDVSEAVQSYQLPMVGYFPADEQNAQIDDQNMQNNAA